MKIKLEINNKTKSPIQPGFFTPVVLGAIKKSGLEFMEKKNVEISIALVGRDEIKNLNKIYRGKNQATDVLSFAEYGGKKKLELEKEKALFLGELVLCYDEIKDYAKKQGIKAEKELTNVASHGILHLLGFRHGKKMFAIQKEIIGKN